MLAEQRQRLKDWEITLLQFFSRRISVTRATETTSTLQENVSEYLIIQFFWRPA